MSKKILDLTISENIKLNDQYFLLKLCSFESLPEMYPGQFVEIKVENSPETFLRRPISVNFVDYSKNELWLLVQIVGKGTAKLSELTKGDKLNLILPLGNTFSISSEFKNVLLIGGGVGIAPLLYLGYKLNQQKINCSFILGGRSISNLLLLEEFSKYGNVYCTTEDGTYGEKGFVTQHSILEKQHFDMIYTCGPTPMMKAVAQIARIKQINCEVSLENTMACGIGACLCCVTDSVDGHVCVCTEGPVFNINKLKW